MDLNSFIIDLATGFDPSYISVSGKKNLGDKAFAVTQTNFRSIMGLDQEQIHVPFKYRHLRIQYLNEHLINTKVLTKDQIIYVFKRFSETDDKLVLSLFTLNNVNEEQMATISIIFNTPDIKSVMEYQIDAPHSDVTCYNFNDVLTQGTKDITYNITFVFKSNMFVAHAEHNKAKPQFSKVIEL